VRILVAEEVLEQAALGADPDAGAEGDQDAPDARRAARPGSPTMGPGVTPESLGEAVVDERLDMFREFVNSLDADPGTGGGSGGSSGPGAGPGGSRRPG